jgi:hypothetical protein
MGSRGDWELQAAPGLQEQSQGGRQEQALRPPSDIYERDALNFIVVV